MYINMTPAYKVNEDKIVEENKIMTEGCIKTKKKQIVSFSVKYLHPHIIRDKKFLHGFKGRILNDAIVVDIRPKLINQNKTMCAIINHKDFIHDDGGTYHELWVDESRITIQKVEKDRETNKDAETTEENLDESDIENNSNHRYSDSGGSFSDGHDLMWANVNMKILDKKKLDKKILDTVWGDAPSKQVTAIMGPSGSGKTSLLNILAGRVSSQGDKLVIESDIRINNCSINPAKISVRRKIAFVAQDDSLQITATPREAIRFSAKLRLPRTITDEAIGELTEVMLEELGLLGCANVLVGGALLKGISGGERKRTAVGVELVTKPPLVFLDEPTSGLDSHNALLLCNLLRKIAFTGSTVLVTIHQPSSEIFSSFDRLILLNKGRVMYNGSVYSIPSYFADCGYPVPVHFNPADHIMRVALTHSIDEMEGSGFFTPDQRAYSEPAYSNGKGNNPLRTSTASPGDYQSSKQGFVAQTRLLFDREMKNLYRNTHVLKTRSLMTTIVSLLIGCIFYQVADNDFSYFINAQSTFGALLMALLANVFAVALPSLTSFPEERPVFIREYSTNHYSVLAYFASRLTIELLVTAIQVTVSTTITYFMVGFAMEYWILWTAVYLLACGSAALGVMVGCTTESASSAIELLPAVFMPQILFSGFFVPPELIPVWLSWISYLCPLTYGVRILLVAEFGGDRCASITSEVNTCEMILSNANVDADDVWWYYLVLGSLFIVFRLIALFILTKKATKFY